MKVSLLNVTPNALETLIYTKNTRLTEGITLDDIKSWPMEKKMIELDYIFKTIQSSWEFVDYIFSIEGVSRAFTHQLVRTRTGSYAQEAQRVVDKSDFEYVEPPYMTEESRMAYKKTMNDIKDGYKDMMKKNTPPQQARGVLPTNVSTNIIAKFNLRALSDLAHKRLCTRTQGEYQLVFKEMRKAILEVHPWAERFIRVYCAAIGTCQFPNYKECPLKPAIFNPETGTRWDNTEGYEIPKKAIDCQPNFEDLGMSKAGMISTQRPANCDEIQRAFDKMELFETNPKWQGNS